MTIDGPQGSTVTQPNTEVLVAEETRSATDRSWPDISKRYAGVAALTDVSLRVLPGEVHAVLGENGAGKSTLMNIATGTAQPDEGTITVLGQEVAALNPRSAAALGIAIVHQHPAVLPDLTVLENLQVALPRLGLRGGTGRHGRAPDAGRRRPAGPPG